MDNLSNFNEIDNYIQKNLYFSVGENKFALPLKNVIEVMKLPNLDYPQQIPKTIVGVLKFNNIVINIVDVRMFLGLEIKNKIEETITNITMKITVFLGFL